MCASSGQAAHWDQIDWSKCRRQVRRLQARIVKATRCLLIVKTGSARAGLCIGLSRMIRKYHVRF
ncbi:MAG: reverse transcriptase N-terminal domain-containing protein [Verrucomicrobiota bacterium]|jgi:hypothetical protein